MEFNYLVEKKRMLGSLGRTSSMCTGVECNTCPLSSLKNDRNLSCTIFEFEYPVEATEIVRKWAKEHPRKTRKDVLLEKFPNADFRSNGSPCSCCVELGMIPKEQCDENCTKCWNTEVEE